MSTLHLTNSPTEVGCSIPPNTPHAISVNLPNWQDNVDYEEGHERLISRLSTGYPRFFIHNQIKKLISICEQKFAKPTESCLLFPSRKVAQRCKNFIQMNYKSSSLTSSNVRLAEITIIPPEQIKSSSFQQGIKTLHVVLFPKDAFKIGKSYWQHTGEGITSRMAEYVLYIMQIKKDEQKYSDCGDGDETVRKRRPSFQNHESKLSKQSVVVEENYYVEERYGRNLPVLFADKAKLALKRRIAGVLDIESNKNNDLDDVISKPIEPNASLTARGVKGVTEDDVFLFPCGMASIFHAHRYLLQAFPPKKRCYFYGNGTSEDIDEIEKLLESGDEQILGLFCEFPSNPLLKSPDLKRLRALADKYDFLIVLDETIGNFVNVEVLQWVDILVSSLTKVFSGDSNVMVIKDDYEDLVWSEDAVFLERNSRTFRERIIKINENAEKLCDFLIKSPKVKKLYYPKYITPDIYNQYKRKNGGYGGLFSVTFHSELASKQFFDAIPIAKGPSLGTNFTLACPYTILAHYLELDWASKYGVEAGLIRISVGLEDIDVLLAGMQKGLDAISD
ncbi:3778_t:CDS:2 [Entrophospora sp. SA101]|nr:3778_t:CDS:2 [Entrophospora sp. SA101]